MVNCIRITIHRVVRDRIPCMDTAQVATARSSFWFYASGFIGALIGLLPTVAFIDVWFVGAQLPSWVAPLLQLPLLVIEIIEPFFNHVFGLDSITADIFIFVSPVLVFFCAGLLVYKIICYGLDIFRLR